MTHYLRQVPRKHAVPAIVAVATLALAASDGGTAPIAYSIGSAAVWLGVLGGLAAGVLPRAPVGLPARIAGVSLAAFALITALSTLWASDHGSAYDEAVVALGYAGVFTLIVLGSRNGDTRLWLAGLAIGLTAVAVLALGARLEPSLFGDGEADLLAKLPASEGRLSEPFTYWNALAAALAAAIVLLAMFAAAGGTRRVRALSVAAFAPTGLALYMTTSRGGVGAAILGLLVLVAFAPARPRLLGSLAIALPGALALVVFASGRSELLDHPATAAARDQAFGLEAAIVIAAAVCGLAAYFADPAQERFRLRRPAAPRGARTGVVAAAAVALIVALVVLDPAERWENFKAPPEAPAAGDARDLLGRSGSSGRYQFWDTALEAFADRPLAGVGASGFEYYWNRNGSLTIPGPNGHSLALDTAAELGLVGLLAIAGFAAGSLLGAWRRIRGTGRTDRDPPEDRAAVAAAAALLVAGLAYASIDFIWENPAAFAPAVIAAALLTGPATAPSAEAPALAAGERRSRRAFAGGVFTIGFAWLAICASVLLLVTSLSLRSSRKALERGDFEAAASSAQNAIDLEPWASEPREQLALALEAENDLAGATAAIDAAIDRAEEDWRPRLVAARIALEAGYLDGAREHAEAARSLAPRLSLFETPIDELLEQL